MFLKYDEVRMGAGDERLLRIPTQSTPLSTSREKWTRWSAASHASEGPTTGGDATDSSQKIQKKKEGGEKKRTPHQNNTKKKTTATQRRGGGGPQKGVMPPRFNFQT